LSGEVGACNAETFGECVYVSLSEQIARSRNVSGIRVVIAGGMQGAAHQLQAMQMKSHAGLKGGGILSFSQERPRARQYKRLPLREHTESVMDI